jgi:energy-coupling factor transport system substrate-specific component
LTAIRDQGPIGAATAARPLRFRPRTALLLAATSLFGVAAFAWPLVVSVSAGANAAHSGDAPWILLALLPLVLAILVGEMADGALDAKAIAMLGVLAACGSALRLASPGVAGFEPTFFLLIPAGRVLGRGFGFVLGAVTLFASALMTGGVGPWLPFQMFGAAWMGFGAGSLPPCRGRREIGLLVAYTAAAALAYGALLNLWFWPLELGGQTRISYIPSAGLLTNLHHFLTFDLTTSLGFDIPRAVINGLLVAVLGPAVLATLRRASHRAAFDAPVTFGPSPGGSGQRVEP